MGLSIGNGFGIWSGFGNGNGVGVGVGIRIGEDILYGWFDDGCDGGCMICLDLYLVDVDSAM
ncbi:predicted protein [Sclerotinia sclerotiorum 1980 UF-70]|uniref:Uncharacterized protein n=1 Tax=Sclerotinia sclerotiorum (strain ATCC 18683 / 1980 / Ss-1) TaxID=665079 RepID=A7EE07_SCLS1|nr:predicted protein [Sclerotinia sclerotiorum 1980 UF-70]EDO01073.1 predicted protein [Sclerotinia sclerotiorum 1980 UF-70]